MLQAGAVLYLYYAAPGIIGNNIGNKKLLLAVVKVFNLYGLGKLLPRDAANVLRSFHAWSVVEGQRLRHEQLPKVFASASF